MAAGTTNHVLTYVMNYFRLIIFMQVERAGNTDASVNPRVSAWDFSPYNRTHARVYMMKCLLSSSSDILSIYSRRLRKSFGPKYIMF